MSMSEKHHSSSMTVEATNSRLGGDELEGKETWRKA